jgi:hypothetical protein
LSQRISGEKCQRKNHLIPGPSPQTAHPAVCGEGCLLKHKIGHVVDEKPNLSSKSISLTVFAGHDFREGESPVILIFFYILGWHFIYQQAPFSTFALFAKVEKGRG